MTDREIRDLILNPKNDQKSKTLRDRIIKILVHKMYSHIYDKKTKTIRYNDFFDFANCKYTPYVSAGNAFEIKNIEVEDLFTALDNKAPIFVTLRDKYGNVENALIDGVTYDKKRNVRVVHVNYNSDNVVSYKRHEYASFRNNKLTRCESDGSRLKNLTIEETNELVNIVAYGPPQNSDAEFDLGYETILFDESEENIYNQNLNKLANSIKLVAYDENGNRVKFYFEASKKDWDGKLYIAKVDLAEDGRSQIHTKKVEWKEYQTYRNEFYELYIRGEGNTTFTGFENGEDKNVSSTNMYVNFKPVFKITTSNKSDRVACSGDIMDLLDYKVNPKHKNDPKNCAMPKMQPYCFTGLFMDNPNMTFDNLTLPATTLPVGCYMAMFKNCTAMEIPPALNAGTYSLSRWCYANMFEGCKNLKYLCWLPNTIYENYSYLKMFAGCTSLQVSTKSTGCSYYIEPGINSKYSNIDETYMFDGVKDINTKKQLVMTYDTRKIYTKNKPVGAPEIKKSSEGIISLSAPSTKGGKNPSTEQGAVRVSVPKKK